MMDFSGKEASGFLWGHPASGDLRLDCNQQVSQTPSPPAQDFPPTPIMTGSLRKCERGLLPNGLSVPAPHQVQAGCEGIYEDLSIPTVPSPCPCPALELLSVIRGQRKKRERKAQFYPLSNTRPALKLALEGNVEEIYL